MVITKSLLLALVTSKAVLQLCQAAPDYNKVPPTIDDFSDLEAIIEQEIIGSTCPENDSELEDHWDANEDASDCAHFPRSRGIEPLGPRLVRCAFHDAVGLMDGFIDIRDPENAGLDGCIIVLDRLLDTVTLPTSGKLLKDTLTKADLVSWAAIAAVRFHARNQRSRRGQDRDIPDIPIRFGRETYVPTDDMDQGPQEDFYANGGHSGGADVFKYFSDKFKFNEEQATTLMGAHTLGSASPGISGFRGAWDNTRNVLDENFYSQLVDPEDAGLGWEQVQVRGRRGASPKFQWSHSCRDDGSECRQLMLNADIALLRDIDDHICGIDDTFPSDGSPCVKGQIKSFPDEPGCVWGEDRILATCFSIRSPSGKDVEEYASDREEWINEFAKVFDAMMSATLPNGVTLQEVTAATTSTTTVTPTTTNGLNNGQACPTNERGCERKGDESRFTCVQCNSGFCGVANNKEKCRSKSWAPPSTPAPTGNVANNKACPDTCSSNGVNPFVCDGCKSKTCGTDENGTLCRSKKWKAPATPVTNNNPCPNNCDGKGANPFVCDGCKSKTCGTDENGTLCRSKKWKAPVATPVTNNNPCPNNCDGKGINPFVCDGCKSKTCGTDEKGTLCRSKKWTAPEAATGQTCPCMQDGSKNPFTCDSCKTGVCGIDAKGKSKCRNKKWKP